MKRSRSKYSLRHERLAAALAPPEHKFPPRCTSSNSKLVLKRQSHYCKWVKVAHMKTLQQVHVTHTHDKVFLFAFKDARQSNCTSHTTAHVIV